MRVEAALHPCDTLAEWTLAVACIREQRVRAQLARPQQGNATELRWAAEGPVPHERLETARAT